MNTAPQTPPHAAGEQATATPELARLAYLFRASLSNGRIHPLYLPVLKYRQTHHALRP